MDPTELKEALRQAVTSDRPHVERMTLAAAIVSKALEDAGMRPMMVGGSAIEFYMPESYATADIDLVVERATRERLAEVFESLGFTRRDRHWVIGDLYFEVPGLRIDDPFEEVRIGDFPLRVVRKEIVLAERVIGYRYWKVWSYGAQAMEMIDGFGNDLDERVLRTRLAADQAEEAFELLRNLVRRRKRISTAELERIWHSRYR